MGWSLAAATLAAGLMLGAGLSALAEHPQEDVSFDHRGGNEWWVEVAVDGQPTAVRARDEGGAWAGLQRQDWGTWAASFHIEPGHAVQFEADGTRSCWFTHPDGEEQCDEPAPEGAVGFDHQGGNAWWVQVDVDGDPDRVQAMDTGGPWTELTHKDWGDWAASFHVEPGHDVRFRALVDGVWQTSCWFTHPGGTAPDGGETCAAAAPPAGDFDARFDPQPGNEWWVEVFVDADKPLAHVEARDDGGPWLALEKRHWGAWARSFFVEDGSLVEFRATSTDGDTDVSQGYQWPSAEPVAAPDVDVAFGPKAGNAWWVETYVVADAPIHRVQARADGGAWHQLEPKAWGTWAASFHVPEGAVVEFRAFAAEGQDISDGFHWPAATHIGGDGTWPEEGSYAYNRMIDDPPGGYHANGWSTDVYHNGHWWRLHEWEQGYLDDTEHRSEFSTFGCKRYGPTDDVQPGQDILITAPCDDAQRNATVRELEQEEVRIEGQQRSIDVWYASDRDPCNCVEWAVHWDDDTGLVTSAFLAGRGASGHELRDTDAPLR